MGDGGDAASEAQPEFDAAIRDASANDAEPPFECPWEPSNTGLAGGRVSGVIADPNHPGRMFATSGATVFVSDDDGLRWRRLGAARSEIRALVVDQPDSVYAAAKDGMYRSTDAGATFSRYALHGLELTALLVHPAEPRLMVASTPGGGLFRSKDAGVSWSTTGLGLPPLLVRTIAGSPTDDNVIVLGGDAVDRHGITTPDGAGLLARSQDGGFTWEVALESQGRVYSIRFCRSAPNVVWAGTFRGIVRSTDAGATWEVKGFPSRAVTAISLSGKSCERVYAGVNDEGIHRSLDGGETWTSAPLNTGIDVQEDRRAPLAMEVSLESEEVVIIGTHAAGFRTTNGGAQWSRLSGLGNIPVQQLATTPGLGEMWLATFGAGLWHRLFPDGTWERTPLSALPRDYLYDVAIAPTQHDRMLAAGTNALFVTDDGFDTARLAASANAFSVRFLARADSVAIAGTHRQGVLRSSDAGESWSPSNTGLTAWDTGSGVGIDVRSVFELSSGEVLIGTEGNGIHRSVDAGESWTAADGLSRGRSVRCFAEDTESGRVFACSTDAGVLISDDLGNTWVSSRNGLASLAVSSIVFDAAQEVLYVGTPVGAFRSDDAGETFEAWDMGCIPGARVAPLTNIVTPDGSFLVAGSETEGVFQHRLR